MDQEQENNWDYDCYDFGIGDDHDYQNQSKRSGAFGELHGVADPPFPVYKSSSVVYPPGPSFPSAELDTAYDVEVSCLFCLCCALFRIVEFITLEL